MRSLDLDPTRLEQLANDVLRAALDWTQALDERPIKPDSSGSELLALFGDVLPERGLGAEESFALAALLDHSRAQNGRSSAMSWAPQNRWASSETSFQLR